VATGLHCEEQTTYTDILSSFLEPRPDKIVRANRRPAPPLFAWRTFGRAAPATPCVPAAVASLAHFVYV
jgi:hypothetical protein